MFDKQDFKNYVGTKSGDTYVAGLVAIENTFGVDLEDEFEKDECNSLLVLLEKSKQDNIYNETEFHKIRDRFSHLRKYIAFMKKQDNAENEIIKNLIEKYKYNFNEITFFLEQEDVIDD